MGKKKKTERKKQKQEAARQAEKNAEPRHSQGSAPPGASKGAGSPAWLRYVFLLLIIAGAALVYSNSLRGTWAMDDVVASRPTSINDVYDLLGFRKVTLYTFQLNQALNPMDPFGFRVTNVALHAANSVLVYVLVLVTLGLPRRAQTLSPGAADKAAFAASLLFALHPININAVVYIVQRMASLGTFFVLLSLLAYVYAARGGGGVKAAVLYCLSLVCLLLGVLSKENAVMAVPLVLLYDYVFISANGGKGFKKRALVVLGFSAAGLMAVSLQLGLHKAFLEVMRTALAINSPIVDKGWTAVEVYWSPLEHVLTEFRVVARYMGLLVAPHPGWLVFDWWGYPVSKGLMEPASTLPALLFVLALVGLSIWKIRKRPFVSFGILWYLIAISLESFVAVGSDLYFEHRNYLPLTGLLVGFSGEAVFYAQGRGVNFGRAVFAAAIAVALVFGAFTFKRNQVWGDSVTLWADTVQKAPQNIRARVALGNSYLKLSDFDSASEWYGAALKQGQERRAAQFINDAAFSLGMVHIYKGEHEKARAMARAIDAAVEGSIKPAILNGFVLSREGDTKAALALLGDVAKKTKRLDRAMVLTLMADTRRKDGQPDKAIKAYNEAILVDPFFSAAYYGLGASYMLKRDLKSALLYFKKAVSIDPNHVLALADLSEVMLFTGQRREALGYAQRAVEKNTPFPEPYLSMANALLVSGREAEAEGYYKKAAGLGVRDFLVDFARVRALTLKGDTAGAQAIAREMLKRQDLPEALRQALAGL